MQTLPTSPLMLTLVLPLANTNYNLYDLVLALEPNAPTVVGSIFIEADIDAGDARFRIGNPNTLSNSMRGIEMFATQSFLIASVVCNLALKNFAIRCNQAGKSVNCTLVIW